MSHRWRETFGAATTPGHLPLEAQRQALSALPRFATGVARVLDAFAAGGAALGWTDAVAFRRFARIARDPRRYAEAAAHLGRAALPPGSPDSARAFQLRLVEAEDPARSPVDRDAALRDAAALAAGPLSADRGAAAEVALTTLFGALAPGLVAPDLAAARATAEAAELALAPLDDGWDGERVAVWLALGAVLIQSERRAYGAGAPARADDPVTAAVRRALTAAFDLAARAGAVEDAAHALSGLAPLLVATGHAEEAASRAEALLRVCPHPLLPPDTELRLRHLLVTAHEARKAFGPALTALYAAMDRCRALDALPMLIVFVTLGPSLYLAAGHPDEARRFVDAVRDGFARRDDAARAELLALCDRLTDALDAREEAGPAPGGGGTR